MVNAPAPMTSVRAWIRCNTNSMRPAQPYGLRTRLTCTPSWRSGIGSGRRRTGKSQKHEQIEPSREGERARADVLRDRLDTLQAQLATVEAEGAASDVAFAELTGQLKEARRHAEEEPQAAEARREAEAAARRSLGLVARLGWRLARGRRGWSGSGALLLRPSMNWQHRAAGFAHSPGKTRKSITGLDSNESERVMVEKGRPHRAAG